MPSINLGTLIAFVVTGVHEAGGPLGRTKLVKLLYFIDLAYFAKHGRTLTSLKWIYYHYGPYVMNLPATLAKLDWDLPEEDHVTQAGFVAKVRRPTEERWSLESVLTKQAGSDAITAVRSVVDQWATVSLNEVLDHAYYHTEPMRDAKPGDVLDFTTVRRYPTQEAAKAIVKVDPAKKAEFLKRLRETAQPRKEVHLEPPPRYDRVFYEGLGRDEGLERILPTGPVEFTPEAEDAERRRTE